MSRSIETVGNAEYVPSAKHNTICEVHRKAYWILTHNELGEAEKHEVCLLLKEAFVMGKKMSAKLMQYSKKLGSEWYQQHKLDGGKIEE